MPLACLRLLKQGGFYIHSLSGSVLMNMRSPKLLRCSASLRSCNIFARASPENKLRIVKALQEGESERGGSGWVGDAPSVTIICHS